MDPDHLYDQFGAKYADLNQFKDKFGVLLLFQYQMYGFIPN